MTPSRKEVFQPLVPGKVLDNDWCNFNIPTNMEVGENVVLDTSFCFKNYFSTLPIGLRVGNNVTLQSPALATEANGFIEIGNYCYLSTASIIAVEKIVIGNYVYIASGVTIVDSDFHPINAAERLRDTIAISPVGNKSLRPVFTSSPVIIEDDVWIGYNATILKGVTVGRGSIISPGAVVSKNVPSNSIVEGNPASIKPIPDEQQA